MGPLISHRPVLRATCLFRFATKTSKSLKDPDGRGARVFRGHREPSDQPLLQRRARWELAVTATPAENGRRSHSILEWGEGGSLQKMELTRVTWVNFGFGLR